MSKIKPVCELAIIAAFPNTREIKFDCVSNDAMMPLKEFGTIYDCPSKTGGYWLKVNGCFDFQEVVNFILANGGRYAK